MPVHGYGYPMYCTVKQCDPQSTHKMAIATTSHHDGKTSPLGGGEGCTPSPFLLYPQSWAKKVVVYFQAKRADTPHRFWRTFQYDSKIRRAWWGWLVHALPLSLYLPSPAKLWCMLQLRGQIHSPLFLLYPYMYSVVWLVIICVNIFFMNAWACRQPGYVDKN
jgi:hypothetical protein